jgi:hypothetical protein
MSFEQMSFEQMSFEQMSFEQMSFEQMSFEQMSLEQMSFEQMSLEQMSSYRYWNANFQALHSVTILSTFPGKSFQLIPFFYRNFSIL